ncbi:hypothetical protein I3F58_04940 [Streptomyces sp. MUM 203J]|uniref:hypothetical protein n=1 Tax=Streptomyces sp. MUM 203J TaxID=2791990 RepID=UPI001F04E9DD|nr:hypothetical protein [Streptomyces sp. MUM 203J]MCH0538912.1 hypothetical protein [Streptomyces sp. MUM 203J]
MTRRAVSPVAVACAVLVSLCLWLIATAPVAVAHGDGLRAEITGHAFGRVQMTVTWADDGDAVDEPLAATVNAVSADGATALGPWRLVREPGDARRYVTGEALPPGRWKVTVDIGHPALGKAQGDLTVSPGTPASPSTSAGPGPAASADPSPAVSPVPSPAAAEETKPQAQGAGWVVPVGVVAGVGVVLGAAAVWVRRRRG